MAEVLCDACGESNPVDAQFCSACQAFLAWEGRPDADRTVLIDPRVIAMVAQRPPPAAVGSAGASGEAYRIVQPPGRQAPVTSPEPEPVDAVERIGATVTPTSVEVLPTGEPVTVDVLVDNRSDIVDGYQADVPSRPPWLQVIPAEVRLLPGSQETVKVTLSLAPGTMIPAQQIRVPVRVRSTSNPQIEVVTLVTVVVPAIDGVLLVRLEPQVVRVRDAAIGRTTVTVENRGSNRPTRITLAGADPELALGFAFEPPTVDIPPGGTATSQIQLRAAPPAAGQESSRGFTITARDGARTAETQGTFVQSSSAIVVDPPVELRLEPSLVRVRDITVAELTVTADNSRGTRPVQLSLSGSDPERAIGFSFNPPTLVVPPGGRASSRTGIQAPLPAPGSEASRTFTVRAHNGNPKDRPVETTGTFVQVASAVVVDPPVGLRLEPELVRIEGFGSGRTVLTVDNRQGRRPNRVQLAGHDPEGVLRLTFQPPVVDVGPGSWAYVEVGISSPRPDGGQEVNRPFTIEAIDADSTASVSGSVTHRANDPRPWLRITLVILGVAMMVGGVFLPWLAGSELTGAQWTVGLFDAATTIELPPIEAPDFLVSGGIVILALALITLFGLTGKTGRLIRLATVLGAVGIVGFVVAFKILRIPEITLSGFPGTGAILIAVGCLVAFIGSLVRKR